MRRKLNSFRLVVASILVASVVAPSAPMASAIIGGKPDVTSKSIVVGLYLRDRPVKTFCSGVLIAPTWVLTAA